MRLTLVGVMRGTRAKEAELHDKFFANRLFGEWFADCEELSTLIELNSDLSILPPRNAPIVTSPPLQHVEDISGDVEHDESGMDERQVADYLSAIVEAQACGNSALWARNNGLSQTYVSNVIRGKLRPGPKILASMKLYRTVDYQPISVAVAKMSDIYQ